LVELRPLPHDKRAPQKARVVGWPQAGTHDAAVPNAKQKIKKKLKKYRPVSSQLILSVNVHNRAGFAPEIGGHEVLFGKDGIWDQKRASSRREPPAILFVTALTRTRSRTPRPVCTSIRRSIGRTCRRPFCACPTPSARTAPNTTRANPSPAYSGWNEWQGGTLRPQPLVGNAASIADRDASCPPDVPAPFDLQGSGAGDWDNLLLRFERHDCDLCPQTGKAGDLRRLVRRVPGTECEPRLSQRAFRDSCGPLARGPGHGWTLRTRASRIPCLSGCGKDRSGVRRGGRELGSKGAGNCDL